jgi:hypothetical protein
LRFFKLKLAIQPLTKGAIMKLGCLRSQLALVALACLAALQMVPGVAASGGPGAADKPSKTLTVTKECGATLLPGELPYCTVIESNFRPLRGAKVRYFGPGFITPDHPYLDSWVVLESEEDAGGTAFGHCLLRRVPEPLGACQFTGGSGSLQGFHADVTVTLIEGRTFQWNGAFSISD